MMPHTKNICIFTASALALAALCVILDAHYWSQIAFRNRFVEGRVGRPLSSITLLRYGWTIGITDARSLRAVESSFRRNRPYDGGDGTSGEAVFRFRSGQEVRMQIGVAVVGGSFVISSYTTTGGVFSIWKRCYGARMARPLPPGLAAALGLFLARPGNHRSTVWDGYEPHGTSGTSLASRAAGAAS